MDLGRSLARTAVGVAAAAVLVGAAAPRATMHRIFDRFAELLPLVLDDDRFLEPASQKRVGELLRELEDASEALDAHASHRDADFQYHALGLSDRKSVV